MRSLLNLPRLSGLFQGALKLDHLIDPTKNGLRTNELDTDFLSVMDGYDPYSYVL
jgi:hypothetical protein